MDTAFTESNGNLLGVVSLRKNIMSVIFINLKFFIAYTPAPVHIPAPASSLPPPRQWMYLYYLYAAYTKGGHAHDIVGIASHATT